MGVDNMFTRFTLSAVLCASILQWGLPSRVTQADDLWRNETPAARDARMAWWREARFGMFIHWGLYAVPAGEWKGQPINGIGEWIMDRANIPVEEYEPLAKKFNPTKFDAAEWVRIAKDAGMKYIVITSKHHDGFCLFDTDATEWDVVDSTPYGKDLLIQLSDECRKQGLMFCTYYSIMDWHHPAQDRGSEKRYNPTKIHEDRKAEYLEFMKQQLKELVDTCNPHVLWFDGEWPDWYTEEDGRAVYAFLRKHNPQLIINNRVGKGRKGMEGLNKGDGEYVGDFGTPEQQIPATGIPGVDWESCMTMNRTWGFKKDDHDWKSASTLIRNLVDIASKGGNYLLNVGPTAQGEFPRASIDRLESIGKWMQVNGASIYGTTASPFASLPWGRCTTKTNGDKTILYFHVFDWPKDGKLVVPEFNETPVSARLLATGNDLPFSRQGTNLQITVPQRAPDEIDSVVVLNIQGEL
jgi:alpha-L-fucosidase